MNSQDFYSGIKTDRGCGGDAQFTVCDTITIYFWVESAEPGEPYGYRVYIYADNEWAFYADTELVLPGPEGFLTIDKEGNSGEESWEIKDPLLPGKWVAVFEVIYFGATVPIPSTNTCEFYVNSIDRDNDGYNACLDDCDDTDPEVYQGAEEVCDGKDNDCDRLIDEGFDKDTDGFTTCQGDCNDNDPNVHPRAPEVCDGKDNDCDGRIDEGFDKDTDGFTTCQGDCNDTDSTVHPEAPEVWDDKDNDCDGRIDEGIDKDTDDDGINDPEDECPDEKETYNNYKDEDGCPDIHPLIPIIPIVVILITGITLYYRSKKGKEKKALSGKNIWLTEKKIAGFWVYPYVKIVGNTYQVVLAIVKGMDTGKDQPPLLGESVMVTLYDKKKTPFALVDRPAAGPLPEVGGGSITMNAHFHFEKSDRTIKTMAATIREDTKYFDVRDTTTAGKKGISAGISGRTKGLSKCCVKEFNIPANRSGRQVKGTKLYESFNMNADFDNTTKCQSKSCEFRQYIRGIYTFNGVAAIHQLPYGPLDPVEWREDGVPHHFGKGRHMFYGHRDIPETLSDTYQPERKTGHKYRGWDSPMMSHPLPGVTMVMNLEFKAEIIDVATGKVIQTTTWTVNHTQP
jgi:hypothetical protein